MARFVQPDTIVPNPGDPQSLNRYSYVGNRPTTYVDPSGHAFASPEGGASGAIAVAVGYALGSQAGQALNVAVAEAQAFVQSLGLQLGNLFPAVTDQFVNPGQVSGTASSSGGNMAGSDGPPEDPFRGLSDAAQRGISRLQRWSNHPIQRFARGYQAQLNRAEYWARQGQLVGVEETGKGGIRYDLTLEGGDAIVEVKYWTARYAMTQSNLDTLASQLDRYQAQGKQIILEMFQTQTNALTQADWLKISDWLERQGIILSSQSQLLPPMQ